MNPAWRDHTLETIRRLLRPGETMVDVGANIGAMSLEAASALGPQGKVHAVEPHPKIAKYLQANLKLNGASQVQCHIVAIGATSEVAELTDDRRDDMNYLKDASNSEQSGIRVDVTTLDELFSSLPHCHLLKLDVEGRELECLMGGQRTLERTDMILVEAGDPNSARFGNTSVDLCQKLTEHGFKVHTWDQGRLEPVKIGHYRSCVSDWIAARDVEMLRSRLSPQHGILTSPASHAST